MLSDLFQRFPDTVWCAAGRRGSGVDFEDGGWSDQSLAGKLASLRIFIRYKKSLYWLLRVLGSESWAANPGADFRPSQTRAAFLGAGAFGRFHEVVKLSATKRADRFWWKLRTSLSCE